MLILCLNPGDAITVDGPCKIMFHEQRGTGVRIAFDAPQSTNIVRDRLAAKLAINGVDIAQWRSQLPRRQQ
jgi:sRNA-binding carbon storage regulator CsrA